MKNGIATALEIVANGADKLLPYLQNKDLRQDLVIKLVYEVAKRKSELKKYEINRRPWLLEHKWLAVGMEAAMRGYIHSDELQDPDNLVDRIWEFHQYRQTENLERMAYSGGCMLRKILEEEGIKS